MSLIYIVDDDRTILETVAAILTREGYTVRSAERPGQFLQLLQQAEPAVAIVDIFFGEGEPDGEGLIKALAERSANAQAIVISGESDVQKTLACLRQGALDFLEKPVSLPRLLASVRNAVSIYNVRSSAQARCAILGPSPATASLTGRIRKLARLNESVLICGESGTGKELVAENLHLHSQRYALPMPKVNCTALNPGLIESELFGHAAGSFTGAKQDRKGFFEAADKSSLFIDEIGDFPLELQSKLLRVLQERQVTPVGSTQSVPVNARLIFATHKDLPALVAEGRFREDLFFRISTFTVTIPPLRERVEDIEVLAQHFLGLFLAENRLPPRSFSAQALARLKQYPFPGNVRELATIVKNAAFFCETATIAAEDVVLRDDPRRSDIWGRTGRLPLAESKELFERELLLRRLAMFDHDVAAAAQSLGMIKNNLYRKLHALGIAWREEGA
jgi:two-component system nitrogen regulation response regulator NtrX